jgi:hypothetical protein
MEETGCLLVKRSLAAQAGPAVFAERYEHRPLIAPGHTDSKGVMKCNKQVPSMQVFWVS